MKINYLFTTLFFLLFNVALSQESNKNNRFELDLHKEFSRCGSIPFSDSTIFLYCKNIKPTKSDFNWKISVLDSNLLVLKETYLVVNKYATLQKITNDDEFTYFLFLNGRDQLLSYRVHHKTLKIDFVQSEIEKGISQIESVSYGNQLFLFIKSTGAASLLSCNFDSKEVIASSLNFGNFQLNLKGLKVDSLNKSLLVTIEREHDYNKSPAVYFYDLKLKLLQLFDPSFFMDNHAQSIHTKTIGFGEYVYSGTYSTLDDDFTEGVYCLGIKDNSELFLEKVIPLNEISAFKRYLTENGEETKELRKAKKNLITAVHEVIFSENQLYLLAEFYGPTYNTGVGATMLFGTVGVLLTYKFDGYLYKGAALIAIDNNHEIEWDVFLNLLPYPKPFTENLLVNIQVQSDRIELEYPFKEQTQLTSLDLDGNQLSQNNYQLTEEEAEKKHFLWYGNRYLDFGHFDKYIVFNEQSITDKVTVKHTGYFIEKYIHRSK